MDLNQNLTEIGPYLWESNSLGFQGREIRGQGQIGTAMEILAPEPLTGFAPKLTRIFTVSK